MKELENWYDENSSLTSLIASVRGVVEGQLDELRDRLSTPSNTSLLKWAKSAATGVASALQFPSLQGKPSNSTGIRANALYGDAEHANRLLDRYSLEDEQEWLLQRARQSVEAAESAAEKAQESAGITGGSSLSSHFETYAKSERIAAEVFRGLAMLGVVGAFLAAVLFGEISSNDWTHLTYRIATVAAAGTLAAYFARQAGQHRRIYNWAQSLSVQLKSFPAFIQPIPETERFEVYQAFARRVLSAPPEKGAGASEDSVGAAQLIDLVTALARKTN